MARKAFLQKGLALFALVVAVFMSILDTTIVNVAIPKMMAVFGVDTLQIQWVITAYGLVVGALVPVTGFLGDRFGYKRVFLYSLAFFTAGSALCGMAWNNGVMILFRIIQAAGGGALIPISMAMAFRMFPPDRRGMAMGIFGIAMMFAPTFGPTIGGYITEHLDWRLIFYLNVPLGMLDFALASIVLSEVASHSKQKFDFWGFLFSTCGFASLLYGLGIVGDKGWSDGEVVFFIMAGIWFLCLFVWIELTVAEPMMDLRLMKNSVYALSMAITGISSVIMFSSLFLLPVFLQNISGLSAMQTGLILLPQGLVMGIMMPISGYIFDKMGAKWLTIIGLSITTFSLYLMTFLNTDTSFSAISGWLIIRAVGMGMFMMPITTAGMNTVPPHKVGQATAMNNTFRQVCAAFGVALMSYLLSHRQTFHAAANADQLDIASPWVNFAFSQLQSLFALPGFSASETTAAANAYLWGQIQTQSVVQSMSDVFLINTWIAAFTILLGILLKNSKTKGGKQAAMMGE